MPVKAHCKKCGAAVCLRCGGVIERRNRTNNCRRCTVIMRNTNPAMIEKMQQAKKAKYVPKWLKGAMATIAAET